MGICCPIRGCEKLHSKEYHRLAARAAVLQPMDTVYAGLKNEEGLGAVALGSINIDPPVARQAQAVLKLIGE